MEWGKWDLWLMMELLAGEMELCWLVNNAPLECFGECSYRSYGFVELASFWCQ